MPGGFEGSEAAAEAGMEDGVAFAEGFGGLVQCFWIWLAFQFQHGDGEVVALPRAAHQGLEAEKEAVADGGMDRGIQRKEEVRIE